MNRFNLLLKQFTFLQPVYSVSHACMCTGRIMPHVVQVFVTYVSLFFILLHGLVHVSAECICVLAHCVSLWPFVSTAGERPQARTWIIAVQTCMNTKSQSISIGITNNLIWKKRVDYTSECFMTASASVTEQVRCSWIQKNLCCTVSCNPPAITIYVLIPNCY